MEIPKEVYLELFDKIADGHINPSIDLKVNPSFFLQLKIIVMKFIDKNDNLQYEKDIDQEYQAFTCLLRQKPYISKPEECKYFSIFSENDTFHKDKCLICEHHKNKECPYSLYALSLELSVNELILKYFGLYGYDYFQKISLNDVDKLYKHYKNGDLPSIKVICD